MGDVTGRDEGERVDGERIPARHPPPRPCVLGQMPEQRESGGAYGPELVDVPAPRALVCPGVGDRDVLIVAWERFSSPRANQNARNTKSRSVSLMWLRTWRMVHLSGA